MDVILLSNGHKERESECENLYAERSECSMVVLIFVVSGGRKNSDMGQS